MNVAHVLLLVYPGIGHLPFRYSLFAWASPTVPFVCILWYVITYCPILLRWQFHLVFIFSSFLISTWNRSVLFVPYGSIITGTGFIGIVSGLTSQPLSADMITPQNTEISALNLTDRILPVLAMEMEDGIGVLGSDRVVSHRGIRSRRSRTAREAYTGAIINL